MVKRTIDRDHHNTRSEKQESTGSGPLHLLCFQSHQRGLKTQDTGWKKLYWWKEKRRSRISTCSVSHDQQAPPKSQHRVWGWAPILARPSYLRSGGSRCADGLARRSTTHTWATHRRSLGSQNMGKFPPNSKDESGAKWLLSTCLPQRAMWQAQGIYWAVPEGAGRLSNDCLPKFIFKAKWWCKDWSSVT